MKNNQSHPTAWANNPKAKTSSLMKLGLIGLALMSVVINWAEAAEFKYPGKPWKLDHDTEGFSRYDQILAQAPDYLIWKESSIKKVPRFVKTQSRNRELPANMKTIDQSDAITIHGVRGESQSAQLVVSARWNEPVSVEKLEVGPLKNEDGQHIPEARIHVYQVGYLNKINPDVLFPRQTFNKVPFSENMTFWITVDLDQNDAPGTYQAPLNVHVNDNVHELNLRVEVSPVVLPQRTNVQSMLMGIRSSDVKRFYQDDDPVKIITKKIYPMFAAHRFAPASATNGIGRFKNIDWLSEEGVRLFEKWGQWWTDRGLNINALNVPGLPNADESKIKRWAQLYMPVIRKHGWENKSYVRLPFDESTGGSKGRRNQRAGELLRQYLPDIPTSLTIGGADVRGTTLQTIKKWQDSFEGLADIWSNRPSVSLINKPGLWGYYLSRMAKGDSISWYIHSYTAAALPALELRNFYWRMYKYGVSKTTLWSTTLWHQRGKTDSLHGRRERRIWPTERGFGMNRTAGTPVGNGNLIYPGKNGPLASVRMELIRDGIEDFDLFTLLKHKIDQYRQSANKDAQDPLMHQAQDLLEIKKEFLTPLRRYPVNVVSSQGKGIRGRKAFLDRRHHIVKMIEQINDRLGQDKN